LDAYIGRASPIQRLRAMDLMSLLNNQRFITSSDTTTVPGPNNAQLTLTKPICDAFMEIFGLNQYPWFRSKAFLIVIDQMFGGTIEKKLREQWNQALDDEKVFQYTKVLRESIWPYGQLGRQQIPRTSEEQMRSNVQAQVLMSAIMRDLFANVVGKANAKRSAHRLHDLVNNPFLNRILSAKILRAVAVALFPEDSAKIPSLAFFSSE